MKAVWLSIPAVLLLIAGAARAQVDPAKSGEALAKKSGCFECHAVNKALIGPAFNDIAARYQDDGHDLSFMSVGSLRDLPEKRKSTVIVAMVGANLHIRVFNAAGRIVADRREAKLTDGAPLAELKKRLKDANLIDMTNWSKDDRRKTVEQALASVGQLRPREALFETVKKGGRGNWTAVSKGVPMPPFGGRLSEAEIRRLVDWVLRNDAATNLKVMRTGLGAGKITSNPPGIDCGATCDKTYASAETVTLTATPDPGSSFVQWEGDITGTTNPAIVTMSANRSVRAVFKLDAAIPTMTDFTPTGIQTYLTANPTVTTPGRFVKALPDKYKQNWILMSRSESLQTGTAEFPRILLPSPNAQFVFSLALSTHDSYPGAHPNAVEFMQWDPAEKNFRFHEIVLDAIPAMGGFPVRPRGVSVDEAKCFRCHSTQNVLNRNSFPGTTGIVPGTLKARNKPNWDSYDSWGGMMPFNRDRIYKGTVEAAAFRRIFNLWTWRTNDPVRAVIEQLELQPPSVPAEHVITRTSGGTYDGQINFFFDDAPPVLMEPAPIGTAPAESSNYAFDRQAGTGPATSIVRGGALVTLHHSDTATSDEGRGVHFFDLLGGLAGNFNQQRIADELVKHRFATGGVPIEIRPIALAITKGLIQVDAANNKVTATPALAIDLAFFDARNGMKINELIADTRTRAQSAPRRKADIQKLNLDRTGDAYLSSSSPTNGLVQQYGAATSFGIDFSLARLRQEIFRRPIDAGVPGGDATVMGGKYVDRESYAVNTQKIALYRYFLEPLGVSVDRWSMGVRGRSRTYTFADVFSTYFDVFQPELKSSLLADPVPGLTNPDDATQLIAAVNSTLSSLPLANAVPNFTDVQRIFNRACVECHGGLNYPPYANFGSFLDLSEDESPPAGKTRLDRSNERATVFITADPATSPIYKRITRTNEVCPDAALGMMPCGGPALSTVDVETIRRWIVGGAPHTEGDPHIKTVDGVNYDFQAAGEFVFLRGEGLEIQVRHTPVDTGTPLGPNEHTGLTSCVSVNGAVAVRIAGHRVTYQPNLNGKPDPESMQLRVDGKLMKMSAGGIPFSSGARIMPTTAPGGIQIEAPGGTVIIITPGFWDQFQLWYLNIDTRNVRATQGLMGAIAPRNWLPAMPDGSLLGPRPDGLKERYQVLYGKFGKAWRVSDKTSLFDYAPGTSTKTFTLDGWPAEEPTKNCAVPSPPGTGKAPLKPISIEVAKKLAIDIVDPDLKRNCIQDVMVTGEVGFAKTYLLADQILRHKPPTAPVLVAPADNKNDLGKTVTFTWKRSTSPQGHALTYRHYVWPVNEAPNLNNAVLVADSKTETLSRTVANLKSGQAYFWKVIAQDGKGGVVESEIMRLEVK